MTLETQKEDPECAYLVREESLPAGTLHKSPDQTNDAQTPSLFNVEEEEEEEEEEVPAPHSVAKFHEHLLDQVRI